MHTSDDMRLLKEYASGRSDEAFAALVSRHVNLGLFGGAEIG